MDTSDSSFPSIMLYLAALSLFGGLLGLFVNTRLNNTSSKEEITGDYILEQKYFHQLQTDVQTASLMLDDCRKRYLEQACKIDAYKLKIAASTTKIDQYQILKSVITEAIRKTNTLREQHLELCRKNAWQSANSEKHSQIKTINGKVYHNVTIKLVSAQGVDIQHSFGYARIQPDLLNEEWQKRFLWNAR